MAQHGEAEGGSASAAPSALRRCGWLQRSLAQLLLERTPLDKQLLQPDAPALQVIAKETVGWIDWSAWDEGLAQQRLERAEALAAERLVAAEERAAREAELVADGKPL